MWTGSGLCLGTGRGPRDWSRAVLSLQPEPRVVLSVHQEAQPLVPAPPEPLDVSLQLLGQEVVPANP